MGAFVFQDSGNSGDGTFKMFRGETDQDKNPIYETMKYSDYIVPAKGEYQLKLTGFSEPVEEPIPERFRQPNGATTQMKTKLELEITSERGRGRRWVCSYVTFSLGARSNLFRIYAAAVCGGDASQAPSNRVYDHMIGKEFRAYVNVSDKRDEQTGRPIRAMLSWDTIAPVGEASDADEYDPFADEADVA